MMAGMAFGSTYPYWANCRLGSSVTTEDAKEIAPGMRMISTTSTTLCAIEPGKATVDMAVRNRVEGGPINFPPTEMNQKVEIPVFDGPPSEVERESYSESNADGSWGLVETVAARWPDPTKDPAIKTGEETLVILGPSIACRWLERTLEIDGRRMTLKTWISDQIPGGLARSEARTEGSPAQDSTTVVVAFLKK
jgi:hypothetical protein